MVYIFMIFQPHVLQAWEDIELALTVHNYHEYIHFAYALLSRTNLMFLRMQI